MKLILAGRRQGPAVRVRQLTASGRKPGQGGTEEGSCWEPCGHLWGHLCHNGPEVEGKKEREGSKEEEPGTESQSWGGSGGAEKGKSEGGSLRRCGRGRPTCTLPCAECGGAASEETEPSQRWVLAGTGEDVGHPRLRCRRGCDLGREFQRKQGRVLSREENGWQKEPQSGEEAQNPRGTGGGDCGWGAGQCLQGQRQGDRGGVPGPDTPVGSIHLRAWAGEALSNLGWLTRRGEVVRATWAWVGQDVAELLGDLGNGAWQPAATPPPALDKAAHVEGQPRPSSLRWFPY